MLIFSKSEFNTAALLSGSFNGSDTLVSSVKKFYNRFNIFGYVVYIYMKNNKGPNTDPCGTPEGTVLYSDFLPFLEDFLPFLERLVCDFVNSFETIMPNCLLYQLLLFFSIIPCATLDRRLWKCRKK